MKKALFLLGVLWASPVTALTFALYIFPFWLAGYYNYIGVYGAALVWKVDENCPEWLHRIWDGWGGHTFGNIVVTVEDPLLSYRGAEIIVHELQHVHQYMRLGPLFLPLYFLFSAVIYVACKNSKAYMHNPFEVDARRGAGELITRV